MNQRYVFNGQEIDSTQAPVRPMIQTRIKRQERRAIAATEFALVLPIMLILTFGTIETCQVIFLKEKATLAAHEGARIATRKMTTEAQTIQTIRTYLSVRGIDMSTINSSDMSITPKPENCDTLKPIDVWVRIPIGDNTMLPNRFYSWFSTGFVEARVVMYKDFPHPNFNGG
jgi:hypothetical protein